VHPGYRNAGGGRSAVQRARAQPDRPTIATRQLPYGICLAVAGHCARGVWARSSHSVSSSPSRLARRAVGPPPE